MAQAVMCHSVHQAANHVREWHPALQKNGNFKIGMALDNKNEFFAEDSRNLLHCRADQPKVGVVSDDDLYLAPENQPQKQQRRECIHRSISQKSLWQRGQEIKPCVGRKKTWTPIARK